MLPAHKKMEDSEDFFLDTRLKSRTSGKTGYMVTLATAHATVILFFKWHLNDLFFVDPRTSVD